MNRTPWDPERKLLDAGDIATDLTLPHGMMEYSESGIVGIETGGNRLTAFSLSPSFQYSITPILQLD
jgi:hypothetical protein